VGVALLVDAALAAVLFVFLEVPVPVTGLSAPLAVFETAVVTCETAFVAVAVAVVTALTTAAAGFETIAGAGAGTGAVTFTAGTVTVGLGVVTRTGGVVNVTEGVVTPATGVLTVTAGAVAVIGGTLTMTAGTDAVTAGVLTVTPATGTDTPGTETVGTGTVIADPARAADLATASGTPCASEAPTHAPTMRSEPRATGTRARRSPMGRWCHSSGSRNGSCVTLPADCERAHTRCDPGPEPIGTSVVKA
jgi:hypothetical protein